MKHTERKTWIARCLFLIAACAIVLLAAKWVEKAQSFDDAAGGYLPGTYAAEANGFGGPVRSPAASTAATASAATRWRTSWFSARSRLRAP